MSKNSRIIGTTDSAISIAESELGFQFPTTFREWLKQNNSRSIEDVNIFPVFDERDPRKTWDSIVRNYSNWKTWLDNFGSDYDFSHLLPFGEFGSGDLLLLGLLRNWKEWRTDIVLWSHETGRSEFVANDFAEFVVLSIQASSSIDLRCAE